MTLRIFSKFSLSRSHLFSKCEHCLNRKFNSNKGFTFQMFLHVCACDSLTKNSVQPRWVYTGTKFRAVLTFSSFYAFLYLGKITPSKGSIRFHFFCKVHLASLSHQIIFGCKDSTFVMRAPVYSISSLTQVALHIQYLNRRLTKKYSCGSRCSWLLKS